MSKVVCCNCKFYLRETIHGCSSHWCKKGEKIDCVGQKSLGNCFGMNRDFDCKFYRKLWYKFWVK